MRDGFALNWRYFIGYSMLSYGQALASAALTFVLGGLLTVEQFGDYRFGLVCLTLVSTLGLFGADRSLVTELTRAEQPSRRMGVFLGVRLVASLAAIALLAVWLIWGNVSTPQSAMLFGAAGLIVALRSPGWFDWQNRFRVYASLLLFERFSILLAVVLVAFTGLSKVSVGLVALLTFVAVGSGFVVETALTIRRDGLSLPSFANFLTEATPLINRNMPIFLASFALMQMTVVSQLALDSMAGRIELAYFGMAMQIAAVATLFVQQLARIRGPAIAEATSAIRSRIDLDQLLIPLLRSTFFLGLLCFIPLGLAATLALQALFHGRYIPAIPTMWILLLWVAFVGAGLVITRFVIGMEKQALVVKSLFAWGFLAAVSTYLVAEWAGAIGYACVLLICHVGSMISQYVILRSSVGRQDPFLDS